MVIKSKEILYGIQYNEVQDNIIEQVWLDIVVHVPNKKKLGTIIFWVLKFHLMPKVHFVGLTKAETCALFC